MHRPPGRSVPAWHGTHASRGSTAGGGGTAAVVFLACLAALVVPPGSRREQAIAQDAPSPLNGDLGPGERLPFSHRFHVHPVWNIPQEDGEGEPRFAPETLRDCMGCHGRPDRPGEGLRIPEPGTCRACHDEAFRAEGSGHLLYRDEVTATFRHATHGVVRECRTCHAPVEPGDVPGDLPVPLGIATCIECHDTDLPEGIRHPSGATTGEAVAAFIERINDTEVRGLGPHEFARDDEPAAEPGAGERPGTPAAGGDDERHDGNAAGWPRGFRHEDHVPGWPRFDDAVLAEEAQASCIACHPGVAGSSGLVAGPEDVDTDLGGRFLEVSPESCGGCHVKEAPDGGLEPVGFRLAPRPRRNQTAGTFSHADHLGFLEREGPADGPAADAPELDAAREEIEEKRCLTCHTPRRIEGASRFDAHRMELRPDVFPRREDDPDAPDVYTGCVHCHTSWEVETRQEGEIDQPAHAELVDDPARFGARGEVEAGQGACAGCHELGYVVGAMARAPAGEEVPPAKRLRRTGVDRAFPAAFAIPRQAHPLIHAGAGGEGDDDACRTCHTVPLEDRRSRAGGEAFRHATHLPEAAEEAAAFCEDCHAGIAGSAGPEDFGERELFRDRELLDASCETACHTGTRLEPVPAEARDPSEEADVPEIEASPGSTVRIVFAHTDHVGVEHEGSPLACEDCHDPVVEGAERVGIRPDALDCTRCHGHETNPETTGRVTAGWVENCLRCHARGLPPAGAGPIEESGWRSVAGTDARQHHPAPDERSCGDCHRVQELFVERRGTRLRVGSSDAFFGTGTYRRTEGSTFHGAWGFPALEGRGTYECLDCHWASVPRETAGTLERPGGITLERRVSELLRSQRYPRRRDVRSGGRTLERAATLGLLRRVLGDALDEFPGTSDDRLLNEPLPGGGGR